MFCCPIAIFLWVFLKEMLNMETIPSSVVELSEHVLANKKGKFRSILLFIFAGAMRALWKTRNDLVFEDKVITSPTAINHKTVVLLSHRKMLLNEKKKLQVEEALAVINKACGLSA